LTPDEVEYILPEYRSLPVLGGWQGKNGTGNVEAILAAKPDVILSVGDVDAAAVAVADRIQTQIQKPVVMIDYSLTKLDDAYALLGEITGAKARAADLAAYCRRVVDEAVAGAATISDKDRIAVYYAEGPKGLQTEPEGSTRTEVLELVGGKNVASVSAQSSYGRIEVSLEQVLAWHPVTILVGSDPTGETDVYKAILSSPEWATVPAVINRQVYQNPHGPFDWFDRPQSVNRVMGVRWLGQLLYPDVFTYDLKAEAKEFYKTFYYTDLNEDQLSRLLERATLALR
jgi:iron complex transport system substrate-binding protein